ncbi:dCTP deaminase [Candidatus Roizmanbacteria bacterium]|nr:dCTP deaminase [Candidatus Roizmanbacteria bacterium]
MVLSDRDIKIALESGKIKITPKPNLPEQLGSCLIDLRLGNQFRIYNQSSVAVLDARDSSQVDKITRVLSIQNDEPFVLHPGEFVLAVTEEYIEMPDDLTGRLEGRSSIGRLGVVVHSTAANIECGFRGTIVLELANMGRIPVKLYPGMRICSISFEQLTSPADVPYYKKKSARYVNQKTP